MSSPRPLILITNDDGFMSKGLRAAAEACAPFGELLIVAPDRQQSGAGRSLQPGAPSRIHRREFRFGGGIHAGFAIEGTPAQAVQHAIFELAGRSIALVVSGINYGENLGEGVCVSGTVGAAMEAAAARIPAIAISLETDQVHHFNLSEEIEFAVAAHFLAHFAERTLRCGLPPQTGLLKIDIPRHATRETGWRWTRLSQTRYFLPVKPDRTNLSDPGPMGYTTQIDHGALEPDSDIQAVRIDRLVSVTPVTLDMTASVDLTSLPR
ncbi:MAG: 5'/3'-nucleotidase SurE [Opitutaceae bacterium]|nr:5'/3'-nucleotidase SurE [Opitutaceae bacterium]